jgi:hypothetical protein
MKRHFEWGEYDSLSVQVPLVLSDEKSQLTPAARAELYKYLGVAAFVQGDTAEAEPHYRRAFELNGALQLDSLFINRQVFLHFLAVKQLWQMENPIQNPKKVEVSTENNQVPPPDINADSGEKTEFKAGTAVAGSKNSPSPRPGEENSVQRDLHPKTGQSRVGRWIWSAGCIVGSGLFGFLSWNEYRKAEENQELYDEARNQRNRDLMDDINKKIYRNDILTLTYGVAALAAFSTGLTFILWKKSKNSGKLKNTGIPVSLIFLIRDRPIAGIRLSMRY